RRSRSGSRRRCPRITAKAFASSSFRRRKRSTRRRASRRLPRTIGWRMRVPPSTRIPTFAPCAKPSAPPCSRNRSGQWSERAMMKGNMGNLMKQAQQLQENMKRAQDEIAKMEVTGEAGGGMAKVVMTGKHEVRRVTLDASIVSSDDKEMLEDLIAAAVNDAVQKVERTSQAKMSSLMGGMNLPP